MNLKIYPPHLKKEFNTVFFKNICILSRDVLGGNYIYVMCTCKSCSPKNSIDSIDFMIDIPTYYLMNMPIKLLKEYIFLAYINILEIEISKSNLIVCKECIRIDSHNLN